MRNRNRILWTAVVTMVCWEIGQPATAEPVREATLASFRGKVYASVNGKWQPAKPGMVLHEQDEVRTETGANAEILLDQGKVARLELKENSYFRVSTLQMDPVTEDRVTLLELAKGKVLVHVEKLKGESKFEVRTPTATTGVRGTDFEVSVEKKR